MRKPRKTSYGKNQPQSAPRQGWLKRKLQLGSSLEVAHSYLGRGDGFLDPFNLGFSHRFWGFRGFQEFSMVFPIGFARVFLLLYYGLSMVFNFLLVP